MPNFFDVLIVGAGHGGAQAAIALRHQKYAGSIGVIGDEVDLPYERPPLSKEYFSGEKPFDRILIRPEKFWADRHVQFLLGRRVVDVYPEEHSVRCDDGRRLEYGRLIWAAGGSPRKLTCPGHELSGLHTVRTRRDIDQLLSNIADAHEVVVVGGGYIGLEAASVLSKLGKSVTLLEQCDRVLARVAGSQLAQFFEAEHRAHGVDVRTGVQFDGLEEGDGRVVGVRMADGSLLPAQVVIVGIGIVPSVEPLLSAGAEGALGGVRVDEYCRTTLADVLAIGDCAAHPNRFAAGSVIRLESVQNANDQAAVSARTIAGNPQPYENLPWFWSNQFGLKLQTAGLSAGHDDTLILGDMEERSFSILYLRNGAVIAMDCVNRPRDFARGRRQIANGEAIQAKDFVASLE